MKAIRDVAITLVVIGGLLGVLLALPFIVFLITLLVVGYITYAVIHDNRLDAEEKATKDDPDNPK